MTDKLKKARIGIFAQYLIGCAVVAAYYFFRIREATGIIYVGGDHTDYYIICEAVNCSFGMMVVWTIFNVILFYITIRLARAAEGASADWVKCVRRIPALFYVGLALILAGTISFQLLFGLSWPPDDMDRGFFWMLSGWWETAAGMQIGWLAALASWYYWKRYFSTCVEQGR